MDLGGAGCYRVTFPLEQLRLQGGHDVLIPPFEQRGFMRDGRLQRRLEFRFGPEHMGGDLYVIQDIAAATALSHIVRRNGAKVVTDLSDDLFEIPATHAAWELAEKGLENVLRELERVDLLTVATPTLEEVYADYCPRVKCLPVFLLWKRWEQIKPAYERERERLRLGWYGFVDHRGGDDLDTLRGVIGPWLEQHPMVDLFLAGGGGTEQAFDRLGVPLAQRIYEPGVNFEHLPSIVSRFDIGLVPLMRNAFNEGKSYLKGLEMAAAGIPCIATPTSQYQQFVLPAETGLLASSPRHWREALDELAGDDAWRRELGRNARQSVIDHYTIEKQWRWWENAYTEVVLDAPLSTRIRR